MAIVVSTIADDFATLRELALKQVPLADLIEIRLDRIGNPGKDVLTRFMRECEKPVIVACNGPESFGEYTGEVEDKLQLLHEAAEAGARFVDVDWRMSLELGEVEAPCHRIVSMHVDEGTPEDLASFHEEIAAVLYEGDVTKLVPRAHTTEDGLRLLRWLRTTKGIVSFCAGEAGSFTRILAPIFGSPFTYCAPARQRDESDGKGPEPTAPGQIPVNELMAQLPPGGISQETAILGVVGNPVQHSYSPWVHGMALKAARLDAVFVAFEPHSFDDFLALVDDENYRGLAVTAPFKEDAARLANKLDEGSQRAGAVNTLVREEGGWRAANSDVSAVRETLERALHIHGREPGRPVATATAHTLILGAGGAARAAAWAVRSVGGRVTVAGRTLERAQALAREMEAEAVPWDAIKDVPYDILIHTTPVGSAAAGDVEQLVIPKDWIREGTLVFDAVYRPIRTALLVAAYERGCTPIPGGEWFVRQAVTQFRLFTNSEPNEDLMRKAFEHAHEILG